MAMPENIRTLSKTAPDDNPNRWSEYEIEAKSSLTDRTLRTLKHGDAFAVLDSHGDFGSVPDTAEGLFHRDTRFLSHFELRLEGKRPLLLSSAVQQDKVALSVELTNPDVQLGQSDKLKRDTIFLHRTKFLWRAVFYERISIRSYAPLRRRLRVDFLFDADFRDLFEVRGTRRLRHGATTAHICAPDLTEFRYAGLDKVERRTVLQFWPRPVMLDTSRATIEIELAPYEQISLFVRVSCMDETAKPGSSSNYFHAYREIRRARRAATADIATVESSDESFDEIVSRATSDAYTLVTWTERGPYPYAGIPWFNTIFGRDGIITAMFMLWMDASIARGVLRTLAATQAKSVDPYSDAQPGKILHEMRHGEMAKLREVPFGLYYGTVDATPLFVILAGMYLERTGDLATIREIWPNVCAALRWIDEWGDMDDDGFVEYARAKESGLANQGWKDSHDAVFHEDGSEAVGPIALCEVQGYVFAAKRRAAAMAEKLGFSAFALGLEKQAERLRENFEAAFWCEDMGTYALALDGAKRPCRVRVSNAGHALFAGIAAPERARRVAAELLSPDGFCGWGIRTLASGQPRYNPMSYHNGSVWPHDNALIAMGFARYGFKKEASRIFAAVFDAARHQDLSRLPELFCGFNRRPHGAPTPYPVACAPQAWSAAAVFGLLGACLGLELERDQNEIRFRDPVMPDFLDEVIIRNLRLGDFRSDVRLHRYGHDVTANVLSRQGSSKIVILK
jgi:glycogen debranching enzyme